MKRRVESAIRSYGTSSWNRESERLRKLFVQYRDLDHTLDAHDRRKILAELGPTLARLNQLAKIGLESLDLVQARNHTRTEQDRLRRSLKARLQKLSKDKTRVLGEFDLASIDEAWEKGLKAELGGEWRSSDLLSLGLPRIKKDSPVIEFYRWAVSTKSKAAIEGSW